MFAAGKPSVPRDLAADVPALIGQECDLILHGLVVSLQQRDSVGDGSIACPGQPRVTQHTVEYVCEEPAATIWAYSTLIFGAYTHHDRPMPDAYNHPGTTVDGGTLYWLPRHSDQIRRVA